MSITVVVINHSSYADYWAPCIEQLTLESEITCSQINLQELWEVNSNFNWDTQLQSITDTWYEENQHKYVANDDLFNVEKCITNGEDYSDCVDKLVESMEKSNNE